MRYVKEKEGRVAAGLPVLPRADRMRYDEAESDLRQHYEATGSRDLAEYARRVAHLTRFFAGRRIGTIGQVTVDGYIVERQQAGAKPAPSGASSAP